MKPIPIKSNSFVFENKKRLNVFQQLHSQDLMKLMRYFYDHVSAFKKMWKDQGKEYWLQFCITLHTEVKFKEPTDSELVFFMKKKELFALELIMNCLCGPTFPPLNKLMETVWKTYKELYKILSSPNAKLPTLTKEEKEWCSIFDYLFGMDDLIEFPSIEMFCELCELYFFAVGALTKICQEYESPKYVSDKSPANKDYWQIPLRWTKKNYEPTPFEVKLIGTHETVILKFLKEEKKQIAWIEENMDDMKETCRQAEEEIVLMPKELQLTNQDLRDLYCWFFLNAPEICDEFSRYAEATWENFTHPDNQFYITFYHSIFNSKFMSTVSGEIKSLIKAAEKKKGNKDDKAVEKMGELCKLASFVDKTTSFTIHQLSLQDFHFFFDRDIEVLPSGKDGSGSDISSSSLLEVKNVEEWKNWDPSDNAHLETSQATLDRLPWDIPFLMAWQENIFALCLKIDFGAVPLRIFPVSTSCKQIIISFNRFLRETMFLVLSSMIISDFVQFLESESIYNWTNSIDYRKKLHEIGYRLRPILDFVDSPGQNSVVGLAEKAWPQTKADNREKWEPGCWESPFEGIEQYFFQSSRHYVHWESAPSLTIQFHRGPFTEAYDKIKKITFNKENMEKNVYYEAEPSGSRYDLDETEKALTKSFGSDLKLDINQACENMIKFTYLTKQDVSRLQKKMASGKVAPSAAEYIISLALIHKKCENIKKKLLHWNEELDSCLPSFIELLIEHRQSECGFKISCAVQELVNDDPKFLPRPTNSQVEKALEYAGEKSFNKLDLHHVETIVKKNRKRVWADNPIPSINKKLVPSLKKENSFKTSYWESQSVYKNYVTMEKNRTELIRIVIDKYFSVNPLTTGVSLFPYWKTLVCFMHSELFTIVKLYEADFKSKPYINKMFQVSNYRLIWLREKVSDWCKDMKGANLKFSTKDDIKNYVDEQYARIRLAGNSLRDLYLSRFTVNEKYQPITKAMMNYSIFIQVLLSKIYNLCDDPKNLSELGMLIYGDCFLRNADELVEYLETFFNHASLCWNYKGLEFYSDFRPISFENCETAIYILKNLLYLCLISIEDRAEVQGDLEISLLKAHSMESEIIDQKAVRGPSGPENDDFNLYLACMQSWQFFSEIYEKAKKKKDFVIPKSFYTGNKEWAKVLDYFKKGDMNGISSFLKIDAVQKTFNFGIPFGPCSTCPECNGDLLKELKNLNLVKKKEPANAQKKCGKNKAKDNDTGKDSGVPTDKEVIDMVKSMLSGKGEDKPLTRNLFGKSGSGKLEEFNLDMSSDKFKKIVFERIDKSYNNEDAAKKKKESGKSEKSGVNIVAEGFKKMFGSLSKDNKNQKSDGSDITVKTVTETKKTEVIGSGGKTITEITKMEITGLTIASEGLKKMFSSNSGGDKNTEDSKKFKVPEKVPSKANLTVQGKNKKPAPKQTKKEAESVQDKEKMRICAACKTKAPEGVKYKKCAKCKEDNWPNPKYYCGRECQLNDWQTVHRAEHLK